MKLFLHIHTSNHRRLVWKYSAADFDAASDELALLPATLFDTVDVNLYWSKWMSTFLSIMSRNIPSRSVTIRKCLPWISQEIRILMLKRDRLFQRAKSLATPSSWCAYRRARNRVVSSLRSAKRHFYDHLSSLVRSPKQFWSVYRSLFPNRHRLPAIMSNGTTSAESSLGKCDLLLSHFSSITSNNAQGNLDSIPSPSSVPGLSTITCDSSDVYKAISSLPQ